MTSGFASDSDKFKDYHNAAPGAKIWRYGTLEKSQFGGLVKIIDELSKLAKN